MVSTISWMLGALPMQLPEDCCEAAEGLAGGSGEDCGLFLIADP